METSAEETKQENEVVMDIDGTKGAEDSWSSDESLADEARRYEEEAAWLNGEDDDDKEDEVAPAAIDPDEDDKYDARLRKVSKALKDVSPPGGFFVTGERSVFPQPVISVDGLGDVTPPLNDTTVKELIAKCQLAPYGHGKKTLVDTQVRNTWELSVGQFQIGNPAWSSFVKDTIVPSIRVPLGIDASVQVEAKLYKMLLYEAGGKFEKHQDSEKEAGMFGTLVMVLPGQFEGGELVVHDPSGARDSTVSTNVAVPTAIDPETKCNVWDPAAMDPFAVKFAAFYGDCPHEVKPVTNGCRLCLTYNLVKVGGSGSEPCFGGNHPRYASLKDALCEYFAAEPVSDPKRQRLAEDSAPYRFDIANPETHRQFKLAYVLDHKYTQAGLSFQFLKNKDALAAACFSRFCGESDGAFELYLCKIRYERRWRGDDLSDYKRTSRSDSPFDNHLHLHSPWMACESGHGRERSLHIADEYPHGRMSGEMTTEVAPAGVLDRVQLEFDGENKQAYTGNEGAGVDRWYESAALVLVPLQTGLKVHLWATPKAALKHWAAKAETSPRAALAVVSVLQNVFAKDRLSLRVGEKALEAAGKLGGLRAVQCVLTSFREVDFQPKLRAVVAQFKTESVLAMAKSIYDAWVRAQNVSPEMVKQNSVSLVASLLDGVEDPATIKQFFDVIPIKPYTMEPAEKNQSNPKCRQAYVEEYARVLLLAARVSFEQAKQFIYTNPIEFFGSVAASAVSRMVASYEAEDRVRARALVDFTIEQLTASEAAIKAVAYKGLKVRCGCYNPCVYCRKINEFLASDRESAKLSKHTVARRFDSIFAPLITMEPVPKEPSEMRVTKTYKSELFLAAQESLKALQAQQAKMEPTD